MSDNEFILDNEIYMKYMNTKLNSENAILKGPKSGKGTHYLLINVRIEERFVINKIRIKAVWKKGNFPRSLNGLIFYSTSKRTINEYIRELGFRCPKRIIVSYCKVNKVLKMLPGKRKNKFIQIYDSDDPESMIISRIMENEVNDPMDDFETINLNDELGVSN